MFIRVPLLLFLFFSIGDQLCQTVQAGVAVLKPSLKGGVSLRPEAVNDVAAAEQAWQKIAGSPLVCNFEPSVIEQHRSRIGEADGQLDQLRELMNDVQSATAAMPELKARIEALQQNFHTAARSSGACVFRYEIDQELKDLLKTESNRSVAQKLSLVSECIRREAESTGIQIKSRSLLSGFFESVFNMFWSKPALSDEDCAVLRSTQAVWSSFYEAENDDTSARKGSIPVYNFNDHNSSAYYWSREQQKGTIPPGGLTLFHADTHSDLHYVYRHPKGWIGEFATLKETQQALNQAGQGAGRLKAFLVERLAAEEKIDDAVRAAYQARLEAADETELEAELNRGIRERINHIAQPVTAAAALGVVKGFVMCMPPWSNEMYGKGAVYDLPASYGKHELQPSCTEGGLSGDNLPCRDFDRTEERKRYPFEVVRCNNETRELLHDDGNGHVRYRYRKNRAPFPPLEDSFTEADRREGFLLDLDLDVFTSHGDDSIEMPASFRRTDGVGKEQGTRVAGSEMNAIKGRMDLFFARLASAKAAGIVPKVITIADSTGVVSAVRQKRREESKAAVGDRYTPDCLSFLLNYMTRKQLKALYPEIEYQGQ